MNCFEDIEKKWQLAWEKTKQFAMRGVGRKHYQLEMFPYPSGRIHMGHVRNYVLGDVIARFKYANGFDVLHPMGWDAFGLPAENAAIENQVMPKNWTCTNIQNMKKELKSLGLSIDWDREFSTCDSSYCYNEQKIFLEFFKNDLVYRKEAFVNYDPVDKTILANEQVINGKGWRSGAIIERKKIFGWFARISNFAQELDNGLNNLLDWPEKVKTMQKNWIGFVEGIIFTLDVYQGNKYLTQLEIFTTTIEMIYGMTFCAISTEHPLALHFSQFIPEVKNFVNRMRYVPVDEATFNTLPKEGVRLPIMAKHVLEDRFVPIFVTNFIIHDYATGAIFGCPAEDIKDREFAEKYNLEIRPVFQENHFLHSDLVGLTRQEARKKLSSIGKIHTTSRLHDWGISRQRYWGCPIPIIYCDDCGIVSVSEKDLPILLPEDICFDKNGGNPLVRHPTWKYTTCPQCGRLAERETDTLDTFFESSWYFLWFCVLDKNNNFTNNDLKNLLLDLNHLLPVDCYIGGVEHAVLHLLYARFFMLALQKSGYNVPTIPFIKLFTQGMVCHPTFKNQNGQWVSPHDALNLSNVICGPSEKMSKSKKNIVEPKEIFKKFGVDATRMFVLSDTPPDRDFEWNEFAVSGCQKFLIRVNTFIRTTQFLDKTDCEQKFVHRMIVCITDSFQNFHFNKAIAELRELFRFLSNGCSKDSILIFLKMLSPFAPHLSEDLWSFLGQIDFIVRAPWPIAEKVYLTIEKSVVALQINGKLKGAIHVPYNISEEDLKSHALTHKNIQKSIKNKSIQRIIIIKNKVINFVV